MIAKTRGNKQSRGFRLSPLSHFGFPLLVLAISLASSFFLWRIVDQGFNDRARQLFQSQAEEIARQIVQRLHDHEQVLLGGNALFHVKGESVTRTDWQQYVSALDLSENLPGILGFGYSIWLTPDQKEALIREVRNEGFPNFDVTPEGDRNVYTAIIWLEPFNWRNRRAFGFDMYSEPVRRKAMDRARDTGKTSITGKVLLVQETQRNRQNGVLMYVPSYRRGMPTATVEERRAAFRGFVYSPIRITDYVGNTLGEMPSELDFEIYSGETLSEENRLFSSSQEKKTSIPEKYQPVFSLSETFDVYGVQWQFVFRNRPIFEKELNKSKSLVTLMTGILASFLLSFLTFFQSLSRRQAMTIADQLATQMASQQRLALHIEHTPLAAIEWDNHFRVTAWNYAAVKIFGYPAEEAIGTEAAFILPDTEPNGNAIPELFRNMEAESTTCRNITKSGKVIVCDWYNTRLVDKNGKVMGIASLAQDITERLQAEAQVQETMERLKEATEAAEMARDEAEMANRAKSDFLANMSHEIRTPMTVFMGVIEHLLESDPDPGQRHLLEMAEQSAQHLRSLIDDILDLARIEAHGVQLEEREFEVKTCVRRAVDLFAIAARGKNLRLETRLAPEVPKRAIGDPDKLGQVLINLVGNAIKFTSEGIISVTVEAREDLLEFAVADTGIGIPEEKQHLLFQKFSQTDSSFQRQYGGTGLGLAISKGLVELMGGKIEFRSRKGKGSVFAFTLPLKTVSPETSTDDHREASRLQSSGNPSVSILLAEDDPLVREMVKISLARRGWEPEIAETGREALKKWEEKRFDLILMDLQMPEMSGIEAARKIRQKEGTEAKGSGIKPTIIIGLTAHARPEIKEQCLEAGMNDVLIKPVQIRDLFKAIDTRFSENE